MMVKFPKHERDWYSLTFILVALCSHGGCVVFLKQLLTFTLLVSASVGASAAKIYGYVENVRINPSASVVKAKLDTGAKSASLDAIEIKEFDKGGETWISFKIPTDGDDILMTKKLVRYVFIKKRADEKKFRQYQKPIRRPIVMMDVTLSTITKKIEVNLTNRGHFNYSLLLGRKALIAFDAAVDPALTLTSELQPSR